MSSTFGLGFSKAFDVEPANQRFLYPYIIKQIKAMILNPTIKDLDSVKTEIGQEKKQEKKRVFQQRIRPRKGHTLFEYDLEKQTIVKAKYDKTDLINWDAALLNTDNFKKEVTTKENCIYISALNLKNVNKILKRDYGI